MTKVKFTGKPRKDSEIYKLPGDRSARVVSGRDVTLQAEIDANMAKTRERSCFKGCRTCGQCANSRRGCQDPRSYDENAGKMVDCQGCERFRFHDCNNGFMRNARGEAEPFTEDAQKYFMQGGRPLI